MKLFKNALVVILLALFNCSAPDTIKIRPEYPGVDSHVKELVDEYLSLSRQNHIRFDKKVTVGFKSIKQGTVIGYCTYGGYFREIDLDVNYWNDSTSISRMSLVYHELAHCYCGRNHDFGPNLNYPENSLDKLRKAMQWTFEHGPLPGYFKDGCPTSLMFPVAVDDWCVVRHYSEYIVEMFERCKPW